MPSYVITGASRGIGYEFIKQLASESENIVVGLVRNKKSTDEKLSKDGISNVTILQADITDRPALTRAVAEVSKLTGGKLDYLINNAALISELSAFKTLGDFDDQPEALEQDLLDCFNANVVGVVNTINAFISLIKAGDAKKVVVISSGMADIDLINQFEVDVSAPYSISKGAVNVAVAKYNALYKKDGILFISISPGLVDTKLPGAPPPPPEAAQMGAKFAAYAPHFTGPITPTESVTHVRKVIESKSIENGDGGSFVSQFGNKQWL